MATLGPQHDWRVIFRLRAWGIMLSAQPITNLHTHPPNTHQPEGGGGGCGRGFQTYHHRSCKVRWGDMCSHVNRCHGTHPKVEAGASIFGWRGRRWMRCPARTHLTFERLRPPQSCEHLWLWHWKDARNIYGSLSWTYANNWNYLWVPLDVSVTKNCTIYYHTTVQFKFFKFCELLIY